MGVKAVSALASNGQIVETPISVFHVPVRRLESKDGDGMTRDFILFSGTSNPALAARVAVELGVNPGSRTITRFPDGEVEVRLDESVRGREVLLIQSTAPPVNDNLVELLALADACR